MTVSLRHLRAPRLVVLAATFLGVGVVCGGACRSPAGLDALRAGSPYNLLIVTVDTIRADHVGAYGFEEIDTPAMDLLAREGILFRKAYSTTPLTLPSHTSLFTGSYPPFHGVRDNGGFVVPAELDTMAEIFQANGYRTAAFVAAYVLDARWGLDQGFDTYFDEFDVSGERLIAMGSVQRPADEVVDEALTWLRSDEQQPFFAWVHLYDPHAPYEPPEPYRSRYNESPYAGEIAFTDAQLARLFRSLDAAGVRDRTIIVLAGDHGESLGEHGENQHGFFVYEEATHVPLIVSVPFEELHGLDRDEPVSLIDIMPTVLEMNGLEVPSDVQGESLLPLFDPGFEPPVRYVYSESWYARLHYGWSDLTSIQDGRYKLIRSSEPELYDLLGDPDESRNLARVLDDVYGQLEQSAARLVDEWGRGGLKTGLTDIDDETRQRLAALGYIGTFRDLEDDGPLAAPREKIEIYNKSIRARHAMSRDQFDEAETLIEEILADDPGVVDVYHTLGELYFRQGRLEEAAMAYRDSIPLRPEDPFSYMFLADALIGLARLEEAERTLRDALEIVEPTAQIYVLLGDVTRALDNLDESLDAFEQALDLKPESARARAGMSRTLFASDDVVGAEEQARAALRIDESTAGAHFVLAEVLDARGRPQEAVREYLQELEITPDDVVAHFNLAMVHRKLGQLDQEERSLREALELAPDYPRANLFLARIKLNRGEDLRETLAMVQAAVDEPIRPLEPIEMTLAYYLLADIHNRLGDHRVSQEWALRADRLRAALDDGGGT